MDIVLAIAFAATLFGGSGVHNAAAVLEWLIAFLFSFYLLSFAVDLYPAAKAKRGQFAVENGYSVDGFPLHHDHNVNATDHGHDSRRSGDDSSTIASTAPRHTFEVGKTGGATVIGTGPDARQMEQYRPQGSSGTNKIAVRHFNDDGRPQRPL